MYLKYGSYHHADNEASVAISKDGLFARGGMSYGVRERWTISGRLQAPTRRRSAPPSTR